MKIRVRLSYSGDIVPRVKWVSLVDELDRANHFYAHFISRNEGDSVISEADVSELSPEDFDEEFMERKGFPESPECNGSHFVFGKLFEIRMEDHYLLEFEGTLPERVELTFEDRGEVFTSPDEKVDFSLLDEDGNTVSIVRKGV